MRFAEVRYMAWAKRTHEVAPPPFCLSTSALENSPQELLGPLEGLAIHGNNAYGHPRLRAAIAARYGVPEARVLCSVPGASMANFLVAAALVSPGERVVVEWPCYEPLWRIFEPLGARIEFLERRAEDRFALDLDRLETAFARGARLAVVTDLMNPTGALLDRAAVLAAGEAAARSGAHLLIDEIYLDGVFDPSLDARSAAGAPGVVVTSSLTKVYGLGGLRAGWAIAPERVVERAQAVFDHLAVEQAYIADELALRALDRLPVLRARAESRFRENYPVLRAWAAARGDVRLFEPDGGFVAWLALPPGFTSHALEPALAAEGVAVSPGHFFGVPGNVRIGFGGPPEKLGEGLARLGRVLDAGAGTH